MEVNTINWKRLHPFPILLIDKKKTFSFPSFGKKGNFFFFALQKKLKTKFLCDGFHSLYLIINFLTFLNYKDNENTIL